MGNQDKGTGLEWLAAATAPPGAPIYDRWRAGLPKGTTPAELLTLAHTHRVVVPVAHTLRCSQNELPPELVSGFQQAARPRRMRMLKLTRELVVLAELFSTADVPMLCLKGPALSQELFEDPTLRDSIDLDLLVPLQYLPAADTILTDAGYQRQQLVDGRLEDFHSDFLSESIKNFGHINYNRSKSKDSVELHWRLFHIEELVPDNREMIWRDIPNGLPHFQNSANSIS
ncbi:MAG: nucleotidyltransferase family protein [Rhodospirillaceae bacterium]